MSLFGHTASLVQATNCWCYRRQVWSKMRSNSLLDAKRGGRIGYCEASCVRVTEEARALAWNGEFQILICNIFPEFQLCS